MIDGLEMQPSTASDPGLADHRPSIDPDPVVAVVADVAAVPERAVSPHPGPSHDRIAEHSDPVAPFIAGVEMPHRLTPGRAT